MNTVVAVAIVSALGLASSAALTGWFGLRSTRVAKRVYDLELDERRCKRVLRDLTSWARMEGYVPSERMIVEIEMLLEGPVSGE